MEGCIDCGPGGTPDCHLSGRRSNVLDESKGAWRRTHSMDDGCFDRLAALVGANSRRAATRAHLSPHPPSRNASKASKSGKSRSYLRADPPSGRAKGISSRPPACSRRGHFKVRL